MRIDLYRPLSTCNDPYQLVTTLIDPYRLISTHHVLQSRHRRQPTRSNKKIQRFQHLDGQYVASKGEFTDPAVVTQKGQTIADHGGDPWSLFLYGWR